MPKIKSSVGNFNSFLESTNNEVFDMLSTLRVFIRKILSPNFFSVRCPLLTSPRVTFTFYMTILTMTFS